MRCLFAVALCLLQPSHSIAQAGELSLKIKDAPNIKVVTVGTSLTAHGGWQQPLREQLSKCLGRPVEVAVVAKSGETSQWGRQQVPTILAHAPDIVTLEFAANDAALHRFMSLETSERNMNFILSQLAESELPPKVIVMAMNPMFGARGMIRPFIRSYNAAHQQLAEKWQADFVDHEPNWAKLAPDLLANAIPDGVHPLPVFASQVIVPELLKRIGGERCHHDRSG